MAAVTVTTDPTPIYDGLTAYAGRAGAPAQVFVTNNSGVTVYLGADEDVATTTGIPLPAAGAATMELTAGRPVYGIVAVGTAEVRVESF